MQATSPALGAMRYLKRSLHEVLLSQRLPLNVRDYREGIGCHEQTLHAQASHAGQEPQTAIFWRAQVCLHIPLVWMAMTGNAPCRAA